jgi:hypothetical protein
MNPAEEQEMELDALQNIYVNEFTLIDKSSFKILLVPEQDTQQTSANRVAVEMMVKYPKDYPNVPPIVEITTMKRDYLSPDDVKSFSESTLKQTIEENAGSPMVYALCAAIVEWLQARNDEIRNTEKTQKQLEDERKEVERKEKVRKQIEASIYGTPVTTENFLAWSKRYEAEISQKIMAKEEIERAKRPTGRQLFETNSKMFDVALDENAADVDIDKSKLLSHDEAENGTGEGGEAGDAINWDAFDEGDDDDDDDDDDNNRGK